MSKCSLLWKHICIRPNFTPVPCCRFKYADEVASSTAGFDINNRFFKDIRRKMLADLPVQGCEECYSEEAATQQSLRLNSNKKFGTKTPQTDETSYDLIEYLEIFVGSTCNLKCMGCSPTLSSSLHEEYTENNWQMPPILERPQNMDIKFIEQLTNLKHVKFVGGEPLLNRLHDDIIHVLLRRQLHEMRLTYYTNCTIWPNPATLATWKNVKQLDLNLSIDGVGEKNEYLRKNSRWEKVDKIARKYFALAEEQSHITLQINTTVSMLNILSLQEIEDWYNGLRAMYPKAKAEPVYFTYLLDPSQLAAHNAPALLVRKVLETYGPSPSLQQRKIATLLRESAVPRTAEQEGFLDYVNIRDRVRNTSFRETFPELREFF